MAQEQQKTGSEKAGRVTWLVLGAIALWWVGNTIATIASKSFMRERAEKNEAWTSAFKDLRWVDLTAVQHLLGAVASVVGLKLMRKSVWPENTEGLRAIIITAAVGNVIGNTATNAAYALISSSTAQVVKACEPIFTFGLTIVFYKDYSSLDLPTFLSVVMVVVGAIAFIVGDTTVNIWGIMAAMISNTAFPTRNIFLKKLGTLWDSPLQKFAVMSMYSFVLLVPVLLIKLFINLVTHGISITRPYDCLISSVFHSTYNLASITVLESVSPVTHAILNLCKRLFVILANIAYFHTAFSLSMLIGLIVLLVGCYFYKMKQKTLKITALVLLISILACVLVPLLLTRRNYQLPATEGEHQPFLIDDELLTGNIDEPLLKDEMLFRDVSSTIFMAWVYDKPIPENVLSNIEHIASQLPATVSVWMFCGTTQCSKAVAGLDSTSVAVKFMVITDLVKGTPLESWLAHHPINKVLAGDTFELNLQEVVRLGILWKYGGVYIDPTINFVGQTVTGMDEPWVCPGAYNDNNRDFLDVAYFPRNNSFIQMLSETYVQRYPVNGSENAKFDFNFPEVVRNLVKSKCSNCPRLLDSLNLKKIASVASMPEIRHYGTLSYNIRVRIASDANLGDEVQGFPGLQFLPFMDTFIERDNIKGFKSANEVTAFFNAWWGAGNWPPASSLHPIMTSLHIDYVIQNNWAAHIDYLRSREPIGCRDSGSLAFCKKHNVKAYFSGCLTLMLKNPNVGGKQTDQIYMADVGGDFVKLFPPEIRKNAIYVKHNMQGDKKYDRFARFTAAYDLMKKYGRAKLVITQRIHSALPAVAMGTPVIFLDAASMPGGGGSRTAGLTPLFHTFKMNTMSTSKAKEMLANFPWDDIPPNPNTGMMMRMRATFWNVIRENQALKEAGMKFGVIPMTPPPTAPSPRNNMIFHLVFTTSNSSRISLFSTSSKQPGNFNWRHRRCLESILHHHPTAKVVIHSNTLAQEQFDVFTESGYSVNVRAYNWEGLLKSSPAEGFLPKLEAAQQGSYWYSHQSDLMRLLVLYKWGGVYMDIDMILVRPLDTLKMNTIGWEDSGRRSLNGAFMMFEKGNPYLRSCLEYFADKYDGSRWSSNGPNLLTSIWHKYSSTDHIISTQDYQAFYMMHYDVVNKQCFNETSGAKFDENMEVLKNTAYAVHLNSKITGLRGIGSDVLKNNTICKYLLNEFCVLCNELF